jgi:hypothetical protein
MQVAVKGEKPHSDTASAIFMRMRVDFCIWCTLHVYSFRCWQCEPASRHLITHCCHGSNINLARLKVRIPYRSDKDNFHGNNKAAQFARGRKWDKTSFRIIKAIRLTRGEGIHVVNLILTIKNNSYNMVTQFCVIMKFKQSDNEINTG